MRPLAAHPYRHVRGLKRKQSLRIDLQKGEMYFLIQIIPFLANTIDISTCLLDRLQNTEKKLK